MSIVGQPHHQPSMRPHSRPLARCMFLRGAKPPTNLPAIGITSPSSRMSHLNSNRYLPRIPAHRTKSGSMAPYLLITTASYTISPAESFLHIGIHPHIVHSCQNKVHRLSRRLIEVQPHLMQHLCFPLDGGFSLLLALLLICPYRQNGKRASPRLLCGTHGGHIPARCP